MKNFKRTIVLSALLPLSAFAAGNHDNEHAHGEPNVTEMHEDSHQGGHEHSELISDVGSPVEPSEGNTVISVKLLDSMKFEFDKPLEIKQGDSVRFVVTNHGKIRHEFSIGSEHEQNEHRIMMQKMPNMVHEDANTVTLEAGETKEIGWVFNADNQIVFACNIPGHSEAGMQRSIELSPKDGNTAKNTHK